MTGQAKSFHDFLTNLKAELHLTNLQLAKRIDVDPKIIIDIDEQKQGIDNIFLGIYRKLIGLKNWDRNYLYEPFIPKSSQKNLIEGFGYFLTKVMEKGQHSLQDIAALQEGMTVDFIGQICDRQIHPDNVNLLFIKKLLILAGKWSETKIHNYYYRPILQSTFCPFEVRRFQELVLDLRTRILQVNQTQFGAQIGVSAGVISLWEKGKTNPNSIKVEQFRALANLKGWTVERLINYIYGKETENESLESVFSRVKGLSPLQKIQLAKMTLALGEKELISQSLEKFSQLLKDYINQNELSIEEASKKMRIKPIVRLDSLLKQQELPTNMELLRLASLPDLLKQNGERYSYDDLKQLIYGNPSEIHN